LNNKVNDQDEKNENNNNMNALDNSCIIPLIDYTIIMHDKIPEFKIVYMVFPYISRGTLIEVFNQMIQNNQLWMEEQKILFIFKKICQAVLVLHKHDPVWAHRDIKLGNILLDDNDEPYLMDFGSVSEARIEINSRNDALAIQEWATTNMTAAYTSPEFFDCPSKFRFDERTDVWALGCLLYGMAFKKSPFETAESGSCALAVLNGQIPFPDNHPYSKTFISLVTWVLNKKLNQRPFVPAIIQRISDVLKN